MTRIDQKRLHASSSRFNTAIANGRPGVLVGRSSQRTGASAAACSFSCVVPLRKSTCGETYSSSSADRLQERLAEECDDVPNHILSRQKQPFAKGLHLHFRCIKRHDAQVQTAHEA